MSQDAIRNLSATELLCALNEKLGLEYAKIRDIQLSSVPFTTLEPEVSPNQQIRMNARYRLTRLILTARKPRSPSTRYPDVHFIFSEHVAASQQVAARDHLPNRPRNSLPFSRGRESNHPAHPRMSILAQVYCLGSEKLDEDIQSQ